MQRTKTLIKPLFKVNDFWQPLALHYYTVEFACRSVLLTF